MSDRRGARRRRRQRQARWLARAARATVPPPDRPPRRQWTGWDEPPSSPGRCGLLDGPTPPRAVVVCWTGAATGFIDCDSPASALDLLAGLDDCGEPGCQGVHGAVWIAAGRYHVKAGIPATVGVTL